LIQIFFVCPTIFVYAVLPSFLHPIQMFHSNSDAYNSLLLNSYDYSFFCDLIFFLSNILLKDSIILFFYCFAYLFISYYVVEYDIPTLFKNIWNIYSLYSLNIPLNITFFSLVFILFDLNILLISFKS